MDKPIGVFYLPFEGYEYGAVDAGHDGDVRHRHDPGDHQRMLMLQIEGPDVGNAVGDGAAEHHQGVEQGKKLQKLKKKKIGIRYHRFHTTQSRKLDYPRTPLHFTRCKGVLELVY